MMKIKAINNQIMKNIFYLFILQGSNYIFPLITFPYLVRTLNTNNYGLLVFCTSLMQFMNIFVDYGFNISGVRDISRNKRNLIKVTDIYNSILSIKIILTMWIILLLIVAVQLIPSLSQNKTTILVSTLIIIGNTLFPYWLYQGLEKMKYITYINIIAKLIVTLLIFLLVRSNNDILIAVFLQTLYFLIPGFISIFFVQKVFKIRFKIIFKKRLWNQLVDGRYIFMTNLWINFYSQGPVIILGFIAGNTAAGNFGVGQKIMAAFAGLIQPIVQAVYPRLCSLFEANKIKFEMFWRKFLKLNFALSFIIATILYILSRELTIFVVGSDNESISTIIQLFSVIVFMSIMDTVMARIMYSMNLQKRLSSSYVMAALTFAILSVPITIYLREFGMTIAVMIAETTVFMLNLHDLFRNKTLRSKSS